MSVYDVLHSAPETPGELEFEVVADSTALEVAVGDVSEDGVPFFNSNSQQFFQAGDNLMLQFIKPNIPYGFGQGTGSHRLKIMWFNELGATFLVEELGFFSFVDIPNLCEGLNFPGAGLFLTTPKTHGRIGLGIYSETLKVSMVNVPAVLVGETVVVGYLIGVTHTLEMEGGS